MLFRISAQPPKSSDNGRDTGRRYGRAGHRPLVADAVSMRLSTELSGQAILLVEDDFFIASDTADVLTRAGAQVIGPSASAEEAYALMATDKPTLAMLDLNLGEGKPRFDLARLLRQRGIPLVFLSGYDRDIVPSDLSGAEWLCKPAQPRQLIETVRRMCGQPSGLEPCRQTAR